jgi:hypothetical protein
MGHPEICQGALDILLTQERLGDIAEDMASLQNLALTLCEPHGLAELQSGAMVALKLMESDPHIVERRKADDGIPVSPALQGQASLECLHRPVQMGRALFVETPAQ